MAKAVITGDVLVVTSSIAFEEIKTLEKHSPKALQLCDKTEDGKKEVVFTVGTTRNGGKGSINKYGISFDCATFDDKKYACLRLDIPKETKNAKEWAAEIIGSAIIQLEAVEAQIKPALEEVAKNKETILGKITIA